MSFQLLYYYDFFPSNINRLLNISSIFILNFPSIIQFEYKNNQEIVSNPIWLDNNVININALNGPSFAFTNDTTILIILCTLILICILYLLIYRTQLMRRIRLTFNIFSVLFIIN